MPDKAHGNFLGKHLVIFGCGYVGTQLAHEGMARGLRVTALTRNEAKAATLRAAGMKVVVADLAEDGWHSRLAADADFVVNCVSSGGAGLAGYRRSYVDGMASTLRWARALRTSASYVYTSSTSVYPQGDGQRVDESAPTSGGSERAQLLLETEAQLAASAGTFSRWFTLRLAGIYGPSRHGLLDQVRSGEMAGTGEHRLNLVYRDDICAAVWLALGAPPAVANGIFNVADDGAARKAEIVEWLAARVGLPVPKFTGEPMVGRRANASDRIVDNRKIKMLLGWRPAFPTCREGYEKILSLS